ncbi:Retrovirus-related Pol polyprotein from transposon TNT 1-94 [Gossypium australe]|uniref:Retrovirus-related Pol polyprotein from transposon TNT 1-94 n=1 Tax=Gossypium australe TaxID=47621 RepID=A0A5B6UXT4_9ROSI|nr:Retrovirus-related Pol polyprotein from transposon TNT 1-94 [Gossypium australe]
MMKPTEYIAKGNEHKVCKLLRSIYGLKGWKGGLAHSICYAILLIGNDVGTLSSVKLWLTQQFSMKDLKEANFVLSI